LALLTNMPGLTALYTGGQFTDAGLQQLAGLKGLTDVSIYSASNFSESAKARLRQNLPNLYQPNIFHLLEEQNKVFVHPKPGKLAPDFTVTTLDGAKFTLSEQRGKVVLLHFWGTWCGPCVKSLPALKRYHDHLKQKYGKRVVLLDLVMDDTDFKLRDFVATFKLTTPQARIGLQSELATTYGVKGVPDDFMIGPDGRILLNRESPEGSGDTEAVIDRALGLNSSAKANQ
jgi:thiol-disulfide isomerase/thioredoxin